MNDLLTRPLLRQALPGCASAGGARFAYWHSAVWSLHQLLVSGELPLLGVLSHPAAAPHSLITGCSRHNDGTPQALRRTLAGPVVRNVMLHVHLKVVALD